MLTGDIVIGKATPAVRRGNSRRLGSVHDEHRALRILNDLVRDAAEHYRLQLRAATSADHEYRCLVLVGNPRDSQCGRFRCHIDERCRVEPGRPSRLDAFGGEPSSCFDRVHMQRHLAFAERAGGVAPSAIEDGWGERLDDGEDDRLTAGQKPACDRDRLTCPFGAVVAKQNGMPTPCAHIAPPLSGAPALKGAAGRTTSTEQGARWATRSLTLPSALRPCRPRDPTITRSA